jgi:hypothetical protein
MAKVILHIGTHKTATTTIQNVFALNAALLQQHGVIYPQLGYYTGHHGLAVDWAPHLSPTYDLKGGSRKALQRLARDYGKGDHCVFLSSEEFSRGTPGHQVDFSEVRDLLAGFDRIEIICVLRPQWQFLQSVYLEVAKVATTPHPTTLVQGAINNGMGGGLWADYNLLYDHLLKAFAPDQITLLDFDGCRSHPGGILGAMLALIPTDLTADQLDPGNDATANISPPPLPTWAATVIAAPAPAPAWLVNCTSKAFEIEYGATAKSCLFSRQEYTRMARHFAPINARLAERHSAFQPDFAISSVPPEPALIFRNDLNASFWMRCNRWIFAHGQRQR